MAQGLRAFAALSEDPGSVVSVHMAAHSFRSNGPSASVGTWHECGV